MKPIYPLLLCMLISIGATAQFSNDRTTPTLGAEAYLSYNSLSHSCYGMRAGITPRSFPVLAMIGIAYKSYKDSSWQGDYYKQSKQNLSSLNLLLGCRILPNLLQTHIDLIPFAEMNLGSKGDIAGGLRLTREFNNSLIINAFAAYQTNDQFVHSFNTGISLAFYLGE